MRGWLCIRGFCPVGLLEHKLRAYEVARNAAAEYSCSRSCQRSHMSTSSHKSVTDIFSLEKQQKIRWIAFGIVSSRFFEASFSLKKRWIAFGIVSSRFFEASFFLTTSTGRIQAQSPAESAWKTVLKNKNMNKCGMNKNKCLIFFKVRKKWTIFVEFQNNNVVVGPAWGGSIRITNVRPLGPLEQELRAG